MYEGKFVLISTKYRGIFAGNCIRLKECGDYEVTLERARCAIRWNTSGGFLELAEKGPNKGSKIGTIASGSTLLTGVTSITVCSERAEKAWKKHE